MSEDKFDGYSVGLSSPIEGGFDVVPDDAADLPFVTRAIMVEGGGTIAVTLKNGDSITLPGLTPGVMYPVRVSRVLATGTTATGIKGLY